MGQAEALQKFHNMSCLGNQNVRIYLFFYLSINDLKFRKSFIWNKFAKNSLCFVTNILQIGEEADIVHEDGNAEIMNPVDK